MDLKVIFDWKGVAALGVSVALTIVSTKIDGEAAERVLITMINMCKGLMVASDGNH